MFFLLLFLSACNDSKVNLEWHRFEVPCGEGRLGESDDLPIFYKPPVMMFVSSVGYDSEGVLYYSNMTGSNAAMKVNPDGTWVAGYNYSCGLINDVDGQTVRSDLLDVYAVIMVAFEAEDK